MFGRWPRQIVSSVGLCRYGGRIDCCWGWARRSWGQCQREYHQPEDFISLGAGTVHPHSWLHSAYWRAHYKQGMVVVWFWHGSFQVQALAPYPTLFQPEPSVVRNQFRYSWDAHFNFCPQYLPSPVFSSGSLFSLLQAQRWG